MSNFWANKLGQQPQPAPVPVSNRPWWQPQVAVTPAPQQQQPQQPASAPSGQQYTPLGVNPTQAELNAANAALLQRDDYSTTKAPSARQTERCPDCDGPNYVNSPSSPNAAKHCFDCGYNPLFLHTTHGATGIGQNNLPTYTARVQVNTPPAGYAPVGSVVGHA